MKSCAISLEETYEALRTFEVLGIDKKTDISLPACHSVLETLGSSSSASKDLFYALKVNGILKCEINEEVFEVFICSIMFVAFSLKALPLLQRTCFNDWPWDLFFLLKGLVSSLHAAVSSTRLLLDFYHSIGSLVLIKVVNILEHH